MQRPFPSLRSLGIPTNRGLSRRKQRLLFSLLAVLNLTPFFTQRYIPTMDGAAHLYNAQLLLAFATGPAEALWNHLSLNSATIPNWTSGILLAVLTAGLPAWVAEKVLVTGIVLTQVFGFRRLLHTLGGNRWLALLALPLALNFPLL